MKYGRHLKASMFPEWRFHFIDYNALKKKLKTEIVWSVLLEEAFIKKLEIELSKVVEFESFKYNELDRHIQFVLDEIKELEISEKQQEAPVKGENGTTSPRSGANATDVFSQKWEEYKTEFDEITSNIIKLSKFNSLNYTGFVKILKKHDKLVGKAFILKENFLNRMTKTNFYKETFEGLIIPLSTLYDKINSKLSGSQKVTKGTVSATHFQRKTTKYWVHPDNVMDLKCRILPHLPISVFRGKDGSYSPCISSVYYDNDKLDLYHERIEKVERGTAIRLRWYGDVPNDVYIERKTHREDWTGEESVKERFKLKRHQVLPYLHGEYTLDSENEQLALSSTTSTSTLSRQQKMPQVGLADAGSSGANKGDAATTNSLLESKPFSSVVIAASTAMPIHPKRSGYEINLSREIQYQVKNKGLQPTMRTFYNRTAFQLPSTAAVRISLDTELTMLREDGPERHRGDWFREEIGTRFPFEHIPPGEKVLFPYAVLEIKLQTAVDNEPPAWITNLINSNIVVPVPKFSKFIHGCATLIENKTKLLPFWLPQMNVDIRVLGQIHQDQAIRQQAICDLSSDNNGDEGDTPLSILASGITTIDDEEFMLHHGTMLGGMNPEDSVVVNISPEMVANFYNDVQEFDHHDLRDACSSLTADNNNFGEHSPLLSSYETNATAHHHPLNVTSDAIRNGERDLYGNRSIDELGTGALGHDRARAGGLWSSAENLVRRSYGQDNNSLSLRSKLDYARDVLHAINPVRYIGRLFGFYRSQDPHSHQQHYRRFYGRPLMRSAAASSPARNRMDPNTYILSQARELGLNKPIRIPVRIEPKVFFANERTFLNWIHMATVIATLGMALLNFSGADRPPRSVASSRFAGLILIPVAVIFMVYSLCVFIWRNKMITNRVYTTYNSITAPVAVTVIFIFALSANYLVWIFSARAAL